MEIEFKQIENGWIVRDNYFGYEYYCKSFKQVEKRIQEFIKEFKTEKGIK